MSTWLEFSVFLARPISGGGAVCGESIALRLVIFGDERRHISAGMSRPEALWLTGGREASRMVKDGC